MAGLVNAGAGRATVDWYVATLLLGGWGREVTGWGIWVLRRGASSRLGSKTLIIWVSWATDAIRWARERRDSSR